jgi:hypothetical protein
VASFCGLPGFLLIQCVLNIVNGIFKAPASTELLDELDGCPEFAEGRDLQYLRIVDAEDALVLVLILRSAKVFAGDDHPAPLGHPSYRNRRGAFGCKHFHTS